MACSWLKVMLMCAPNSAAWRYKSLYVKRILVICCCWRWMFVSWSSTTWKMTVVDCWSVKLILRSKPLSQRSHISTHWVYWVLLLL